MLLLAESTRVEAVTDTKEREANIRQEPLCGLADREGQKLDDGRAEGDAGLAHHKQLIDESDQDDEAHPNDPDPDGAHGQGRVVVRIDDGSDLGIGAVGREQRDLDLGLADGAGVLGWLFKVLAVVDELLEMLQGS